MKLPFEFNKNQKEAMIFMVLVALLAVILYFNLLLRPQVVRVFDVIVKAGKMGSDLRAAESDIANIGKFKKDIEAYKEKVDRYEKMLPAEQEIPSLLQALSLMAKSSGIKIVGITPVVSKSDKSQKNRIYNEIPILISAKSGYHELGRFLCNLEKSDRFMKVVDIQIKANNNIPKKHDVELLILTYTLSQNK